MISCRLAPALEFDAECMLIENTVELPDGLGLFGG
jgi:hypothetical protein